MNTTPFEKLKLTLVHQLIGFAKFDKRYYQCIKALHVASEIHTKTRKDGVTPEFSHQLNMLSFAISIHELLISPYYVYTTILFHDALEDYPRFVPKGYEDRCNCFLDYLNLEFKNEVDFISRISKEIHVYENGAIHTTVKDKNVYFDEMANCPVCSIAKGIDRYHNISTMSGVFSLLKQLTYIKEVKIYFLPMLKKSRKKYLEQRPAYELLKSILNVHCETIKYFIDNVKNK